MKLGSIALVIALGFSSTAYAQFGGLLGGSKPAATADIGAQVEAFNANSLLLNKAVGFALLQVKAALGSKEDMAAVKAKSESLSKTTDAKEAGEIAGTILKDDKGAALALLKDKDAKAKMEKLSPAMQQAVAKSLLAAGIASLQMPALAKTGQNILSGAGSNPMNISKLLPVKTGLSSISDALPVLPGLVAAGFQLMRDVKVDPGNPTADSKIVTGAVTLPE